MRNQSIGGFRTINAYVADKLRRFSATDKSFGALFGVMFSEKENVMFEQSEGYRIVKTTYGECEESILRRASTLKTLLPDCPQDAVVGLHMQNSRAWIEMFWCILLCGWRPLLMNLRLDRETLSAAVEAVGARAVITSESDAAFPVPVFRAEEIAPADARITPAHVGGEALVMSSGTSRHVKVCAYSGEELYAMIRDSFDIIRRCPQMKRHYEGQLKQLAFLPFYHIFGLVAVYLWFGFFSRTFVLLKDMTPQTILDTIRRHEVTHIFAVPLLWNKVYDQAIRAIRDRGDKTWRKFEKGVRVARALDAVPPLGRLFSRIAFREIRQNLFGESICFLISGGSEIRPAVLEFFNAVGYRLANGYGMTEIGITSVELSANRRLLASGSVGAPFSSLQYRIDDHGCLQVRGASLARYILEDGQRRDRGDDWFSTGDLAECKAGRYYVLGRRDDLVISPTGENLNPNLIEEKLLLRGIRQLCLVGVRRPEGVQPALVVSPNPLLPAAGLRKLRDQLQEKLRALGLEHQVGQIVFVRQMLMREDEIKLNRGRIASDLQQGLFTVLHPDAPGQDGEGELAAHIRALFAEALGKKAEDIGDGDDFFLDLGGSSLDYFSVVAQLQNEFGILFPAQEDRSLSRPGEIAQYITGLVSGRD